MKPTAVIVDDDALARARLKDLICEVPLVDVVGEAADGPSAVSMIDELEPDIVFLDIEMPALTGLQVAERIRHAPAVIFTTAYGHYAVTAFELSAVDYLLKPFGRARFQDAVERAIASRAQGDDLEAVRTRAREAWDAGAPLSRIFLRERDQILPLPIGDVMRFEADGDYTIVHTRGREHLVRLRLQDLERQLGDRFLRVHRSHLVNLDHVVLFEHQDDARLVAVMSDGSRVVASRSKSRDLRRLAR